MPPASKSSPPKAYALRFISGKYQGGDFALPASGDLTLGRSSDLDIVLVEDMVSRRHATIRVVNGEIIIRDLGSTNGTFVNGEKVRQTRIVEGDQILVGTNVIRLVTVKDPMQLKKRKSLENVASAKRRTSQVPTMSGLISEVGVPDLLQLFAASKKSGILLVHPEGETGRIYMEEGRVIFAIVDDPNMTSDGHKLGVSREGTRHVEVPPPFKWFLRILQWNEGSFEMAAFEAPPPGPRIEMSVEALLMESMRQVDEMKRLLEEAPVLNDALRIPSPLEAPLRMLSPRELEILETVHNEGSLERVLNRLPYTDYEIAETVQRLLEQGYLETLD